MKSRHSYGLCSLLEEEPEGGGRVMPIPMVRKTRDQPWQFRLKGGSRFSFPPQRYWTLFADRSVRTFLTRVLRP
jgi:hypothetical protein